MFGTLYIVYGTCSDENFVRVPIRGQFEARLADPMDNDLIGSENPVQKTREHIIDKW